MHGARTHGDSGLFTSQCKLHPSEVLALHCAAVVRHVIEAHGGHVPALRELHDGVVALLAQQPRMAASELPAQDHERRLRLLGYHRLQLVFCEPLRTATALVLRFTRLSRCKTRFTEGTRAQVASEAVAPLARIRRPSGRRTGRGR